MSRWTSLLSGYVLQVGDRVFDNSGRHQLDQMMAGKPSLATLKTRIEDYKPAQTSAEGGVVISSADGIVQVEGMDKAVYGEIVTFENGAKGMVESVDPSRQAGHYAVRRCRDRGRGHSGDPQRQARRHPCG